MREEEERGARAREGERARGEEGRVPLSLTSGKDAVRPSAGVMLPRITGPQVEGDIFIILSFFKTAVSPGYRYFKLPENTKPLE